MTHTILFHTLRPFIYDMALISYPYTNVGNGSDSEYKDSQSTKDVILVQIQIHEKEIEDISCVGLSF